MKERKLYWTLEQSGAQLQKKLLVDREAEKQLKIAIKKEAETKLELEKEEIILQQRKNEALEIERQIGEDIAEGDPTSQVAELGVEITKLSTTLKSQTLNAFQTYNKELIQSKKGQKEVKTEVDKTTNSFQQAAKNVFSYGIAFTALRRIYRETIRTITELDKALTEMSVVTTMNRQETQMLVGTFQNLAKETGFTTTEIAKLSTVYFRQGRSLKDVIELTTIAAKAARIAGIGATESANLLTAAVNGFGLAAKEAEAVSDKFAALAASSASSYQELAVGLSKFASQAKVAGLSLDFAMGLLAKGVETTREAPESIGTALKTILARMRELTDLGKTLEDGMDVSRVDTALRQIGVNLRDTNGQFRDMEDVLTEVGNKFSSLNKMQQASVAVALAGTRQQSRLLAIFQDFDRTLELVETSEESAGATMAQHLKFMEGMEASLTNLRTSYQKFITTITESEVVIGIVRTLSSAIDGVTNILNSLGLSGKNAMIIMIGLAGAMQSYNLLMRISKTQLGEVIGLNKIFNADTKISTLLTSLRNKMNLQEIITNHKKIISGQQTNLVEKKNLLLQSIGIKNITKKLFLLPAELATMKMKIVLTNLDTVATKKKTIADFLGVKAIKAKILAVKAFNTSLLASPIAPIILALMLLVGAFMLLKKGAEDSKNGVDSFASGLFKGIQALGAIFKSLFDALKGLFNILKPFILIFAAVSFAPIIFAVGKILLVFKAITIVIRILNVILQRAVHFFKEFVSNSPLLKDISKGFKFIVDFGKQVVDFFRKGAKVFSE
jgi:TP901 family phage tail tape measure protein